MANPDALKPADHPFACLLLLDQGIYIVVADNDPLKSENNNLE